MKRFHQCTQEGHGENEEPHESENGHYGGDGEAEACNGRPLCIPPEVDPEVSLSLHLFCMLQW